MTSVGQSRPREEVEASVATRFTLAMNAAVSPLGAFTDFVHAGMVAGVVTFAGFFVAAAMRSAAVAAVTSVVALVPFVAAALVARSLADGRERVLAFLEKLPFDVVNLNALLAGLGDTLEVELAEAPLPTRDELQPRLDAVSDDVLLTATRADERVLVLRLGVIDSKRRPHASAHARWVRFVAVVDRVLVPLAAERRVVRVLVV